jgi:hypothetical protein
VEKEGTHFDVISSDGDLVPLRFLHQISIRPSSSLPNRIEAPVTFRGYCGKSDMETDVKEKFILCFGSKRKGMVTADERLAAAIDAGAAGLIELDDTGFTIEPARWPVAYSRLVTLPDTEPVEIPEIPVLRLNADSLEPFLKGTRFRAKDILFAGAAAQPLPSFDLMVRFLVTVAVTEHYFTSDNILALLPGTDRKLAKEVLVISAHLDGYGRGEPVEGDNIYNGALDDAAYVSTLIRLAERRKGRGFRRPVLFAVFTGEEKGLLGSKWFTKHPTLPKDQLIADINLDALRPIFPLKSLTMLSRDETTLGASAKAVASTMNIEIRPDFEPERNMKQRTDAAPFLSAGIPSTTFIFGYDPDSVSERIYRDWYRNRYHKPQDDLTTQIDWQAAADMNRFLYKLTAYVANDINRPVLLQSR